MSKCALCGDEYEKDDTTHYEGIAVKTVVYECSNHSCDGWRAESEPAPVQASFDELGGGK